MSSDISTASYRLYDYAREPKKRVIAEGLVAQYGLKCDLANLSALHSHGVCEGLLEIDHKDGNPLNWTWKNLRLLCKAHNLQQRSQRSTSSVREQKPGERRVSFSQAGFSPQSVSMENEKSENYLARFRPASIAFLTANPGIHSIRSFKRRMIGACTYTDEAGKLHEPSGATIERYISDRIYPDNPNGLFVYEQTSEAEDGITLAVKGEVQS